MSLLVQRARYFIKSVLDDAYDFLSQVEVTRIEKTADPVGLVCTCIAIPKTFKLADHKSPNALDTFSFHADLFG